MNYAADDAFAARLDAEDPLRELRALFELPQGLLYFCGNSLGPMPCAARPAVERELDDWARLGVEGHFHGRVPWFTYHEAFRESCARLVGALPSEVIVMNTLTVNLHLMLASFYRPTPERHKILVEDSAFPSDMYAVASQIRHHGYDPAEALVVARPRPREDVLRTEDVEELLAREGASIAVVLLGAVQFATGQWFDMPRITAAARRAGCVAGWDLAHAAGNVPLRLHDWDADFAVWCSYKYLNAGPGAVAGCFVHERHGGNPALPRLAGWWGNDPATRFAMPHEFVPRAGADGWQLSNPPILSLAPLRAALDVFDQAGIDAIRRKSVALTGYLEFLVQGIPAPPFRQITPREVGARGAQLSLRVRTGAAELCRALRDHGVVADSREPDILRLAPAPLFNTFGEVLQLGRILARLAA
ncbi:MAG: kynureninase [Acidobacteria bacterium]|nr:kynureninase [Acidobacteriota bacterium]